MSGRRLIDFYESDLEELLVRKLIELDFQAPEPLDPDRALTRKSAAALLDISLGQLDILCRKDKDDPIPYYIVGESRRFIRSDLVLWLRRQTAPTPP